MLAARVGRIQPSPTLAISAKANQLRLEGIDVISLAAGEPDFDTPEHIKRAAVDAINAGQTKYTPVDGTNHLKEAIIDKLKRDNQLDYEPQQILVSNGGKQSFYNLCQALIEEGDEVIIPAPYWVSYPDMVLLAHGTPVYIHAGHDQHFKITPEQLDAAITTKTKLVVINSPSNPTGACYTREELTGLIKVLEQYPHVVIATDDMYEHILFQQHTFHNVVSLNPELKTRTVVLNGVSKAYSMTGWRIGYAAGPLSLIQSMKKIQSQSTSNPCSISQAAAAAALAGDQTCVTEMREAFEYRHQYVVDRLNQLELITCLPSAGTFYCFPNVQAAVESAPGIQTDVDFTEYLLEKANIAAVPGTAFGLPGHVRLSFATSMEKLTIALDRLEKVMADLR